MSFKVALPNKDTESASITELAVTSQYPAPKINVAATPLHSGIVRVNWQSSITMTLPQTRMLYSIPHGYNYVPSVLGAFKYDDGLHKLSGVMGFAVTDATFSVGIGQLVLDSDAKNINLLFLSTDDGTNPIPPFLMQVRFMVFAERGHL